MIDVQATQFCLSLPEILMVPPALAILLAIEYLEPTENLCAATQLLRILRMTSREGL